MAEFSNAAAAETVTWTLEEMNAEILECARYGEPEDLETLLKAGANVNFVDGQGNTCMHKAAANGEVECLQVLKKFDAMHVPNMQGNTPLQWAVQNKKKESITYLVANFEVDMLLQNGMGISTLTDAFSTSDTEIIEICLSHSSASEERLVETNDPAAAKFKDDSMEQEQDSNTDENPKHESSSMEEESRNKDKAARDHMDHLVKHAVVHQMNLSSSGARGAHAKLVKVRELPISRADTPFGSDTAPEDDTTGLAIWPAAIILSRWIARLAEVQPEMLRGMTVMELGAGCGLPGLATALLGSPARVYITDIHHSTLVNAAYNARLNTKEGVRGGKSIDGGPKHAYGEVVYENPPPAKVSGSPTDEGGAMDQEPPASATLEIEARTATTVTCAFLNWQDESTYPSEQMDVLVGSDLVYESKILKILVPAVKRLLKADGSFLYCAPESGRDGMAGLIEALAAIDIVCVEQTAAPDYMYGNPLTEVDEDFFVLHFYDLAAKQRHYLYHFRHKDYAGVE